MSDFYTNKNSLVDYALLQKDVNGNQVFTAEDFENPYANISVITNYLAFSATQLANKFQLYKNNSIQSSSTDFNIIRKLAKIQNGYSWKRNKGAILYSDVYLKADDLISKYFSSLNSVTIPKLTPFILGSYKYYNLNDVVFNKADVITHSGQTPYQTVTVSGVEFIQGEYFLREFIYKSDLLVVFTEASKVETEDIFVETDIIDPTTGITSTQTVKYYSEEEYLALASTINAENIYYTDFYEDNIIYKFNIQPAIGKKISVILYKNDGYLDTFSDDISTGTLKLNDSFYVNNNDIKGDLYCPLTTDSCSNGSNAETLADLQALGNRVFIETAVNDNDYNELLGRNYRGAGFKLSAYGGENVSNKYIGYVVFTGINNNKQPLGYNEILGVKMYLDSVRGTNIRPIYIPPVILTLDFDIKLTPKLQYKGRLEEFKTSITNNINNYIEGLYSDVLSTSRSYIFNTLLMANNDLMPYIEKLDIIQTVKYKLHINNKTYLDLLTTSSSDTADSLFTFGSTTLLKSEVYDLFNGLSFRIINNVLYQNFDHDTIGFNYLQSNITSTNSQYQTSILYKSTNNIYYYALYTGSETTAPFILYYPIIEIADNNYVVSYNVNYLINEYVNFTGTEKYITAPLYKTLAEEHYLNDITFKRNVFLVVGDITFS